MTSRRFEVICCCVVNLAAAGWGCFYPRPYGLCIAVLFLLPWLSIIAGRSIRSGNAFAYAAVCPISAIGLRACIDLDFASLGRLTVFSFAVGALFARRLFFLADRTAWKRYGLALILGALFYGFGVAAEADVLLDASTTKTPAVPIISRECQSGRTSTCELVLAPWGDRLRPNRNPVMWMTYFALRGKSEVCIDLGSGALGVAWHMIAACPR